MSTFTGEDQPCGLDALKRAAALGVRHMKAPIDKSKWSEQSRGAIPRNLDSVFYLDIKYRCDKCSDNCIYTGEQQKEDIEVSKKYPWITRNLCARCYENYNEIKRMVSDYERQWKELERSGKESAYFVNAWINCLESMKEYGKPVNTSMIEHLKSLSSKHA